MAPSHGHPEPMGFRPVKTPGAAALVAAAGAGGVEAALGLLAAWVGWKTGMRPLDLRQGQDAQSARGRALVARLAIEHRLCSSAFVGRYFGRAKATISEQVAASRRRIEDTGIVATPVARILEELTALRADTGVEAKPDPGEAERS